MRRTMTLATSLVVALIACRGSAEPTATYTGGACDYDGPSEFDLNSTVTFTVVNGSDTTDMGFGVGRSLRGPLPIRSSKRVSSRLSGADPPSMMHLASMRRCLL